MRRCRTVLLDVSVKLNMMILDRVINSAAEQEADFLSIFTFYSLCGHLERRTSV